MVCVFNPITQKPANFIQVMDNGMNFMEKIATTLFDYVCESLTMNTSKELNKYCDQFVLHSLESKPYNCDHVDASCSIFDAFYYYNTPQVEKYTNCAGLQCDCHVNSIEHTDPGFFAIATCSDVPGLEVMDCASGEWIPVEELYNQNHLIVMGGEALQLFSTNLYKATVHRVVGGVAWHLTLVQEKNIYPRLNFVYELRPQDEEKLLSQHNFYHFDTNENTFHVEDDTDVHLANREQ